MLRASSRAWRVSLSFRLGSSAHFHAHPSLAHDAPHSLLDRVRTLAARGLIDEALALFYSASPEHRCSQTYAALFHECARRSCLTEGLSLHRHMAAHGFSDPPDLFVWNHIVNMYCKCGYLDYAHKLFDEMPDRNIVSWTVLISGYAQCGRSLESFRVFSLMLREFRPNEFAFASVLSSCFEGCGRFGRQVHGLAVKMCLDVCTYVANALVSMYSKIGVCENGYDGKDDAWLVFRSIDRRTRSTVSWNSMISVFQHHGFGDRAINLFTEMRREGIGIDRATLLSVFSSIQAKGNDDLRTWLRFCVQLHCLSIRTGYSSEVKVATALVKSYSDLGDDADDSIKVFYEADSHRDIVLWTSIITALSEQDPEKALLLFSQLCQEGLTPDWHTLSITIKACSYLLTETLASTVHSRVIKGGFDDETVLSNSLIHAYSRCGSVSMARQVFYEIEERDTISWNSMLKAYALHGQAKEALDLFSEMDQKPDSATFVALLSACSHAGLVEEGARIFGLMHKDYGIVPQLDHYACMVDLYGRAGKIDEAEKLIDRIPMEPDSVVWSALLGSCRKHGETRLAKLAAEKLKTLKPRSSLGYTQMSNMYNSSGHFNEAGLVWNEMKQFRVRKEPGLSWVQIGNQVHEFASGGHRHANREAICRKLEELIGKLKEIGYVPETSLALLDVEDEQKEEQLYYHSEKLALAFSILNENGLNRQRGVVKIIKNIRICVDCHLFMKLASDLLQNEIVVRDSNRFHHFKSGTCSCNDYW